MLGGRTRWAGVLASTVALGVLAAPVQAQFGGLLGGSRSSSKTTDGCSEGRSRSSSSRIAGGILGSVASSAVGNVGGVFNFVPIAGLTDQLTAAIACKLDPEEQKQAAEATLAATRSDDGSEVEVGSMAEWTSESRDDVTGTSTVVARNDQAGDDGLQCITVTDVIIVKGEETRADKRMCRRPPARYALAA